MTYHGAMTSTTLHSPRHVPLRQDASIIALVSLAHASSHFAHLLLPLMFPVFLKEFILCQYLSPFNPRKQWQKR